MCQISLAACATTPWQFKIPDWIRKTIPNDSHDCSAWSQLVLELLQIRSKKNPRRLLYRPRPKSITAKMHMLWFRCNKSIDQHTYFQPCTSKQSFNMLLAGPCMTRRFVSRSFYPSKPPEPPSSSKINIGWWNLERTQPELMFTHESKTLFHSASCGDCQPLDSLCFTLPATSNRSFASHSQKQVRGTGEWDQLALQNPHRCLRTLPVKKGAQKTQSITISFTAAGGPRWSCLSNQFAILAGSKIICLTSWSRAMTTCESPVLKESSVFNLKKTAPKSMARENKGQCENAKKLTSCRGHSFRKACVQCHWELLFEQKMQTMQDPQHMDDVHQTQGDALPPKWLHLVSTWRDP